MKKNVLIFIVTPRTTYFTEKVRNYEKTQFEYVVLEDTNELQSKAYESRPTFIVLDGMIHKQRRDELKKIVSVRRSNQKFVVLGVDPHTYSPTERVIRELGQLTSMVVV